MEIMLLCYCGMSAFLRHPNSVLADERGWMFEPLLGKRLEEIGVVGFSLALKCL